MVEIKDESMTFSGSDKLSWGFVIQRKMSQCVDSEGDLDAYTQHVKELYDCTYTNFYGLNFKKEIDKRMEPLNHLYTVKTKAFLFHYNKWYKSGSRDSYKSIDEISFMDMEAYYFRINRTYWYWHCIFNIIRDIFAENRGLFFGSDDMKFSQQMRDSD